MAVQPGERGIAGRVVDVLEHKGSASGQVTTEVVSELSEQRPPAEHGSWLLGHRPEGGLARVMVKAPGRCHHRQQECCRVAILAPTRSHSGCRFNRVNADASSSVST